MRSSSNIAMVVTALAGVFGTAACTLASPTYITSTEGSEVNADGGASSSSSSSSGAPATGGTPQSCAKDDYVKPDLATLTACADGKGHCFDKDKTDMAELLVACPDATKVCVPDEVLTGSGAPMKPCASIAGAGGCVTTSLYPTIKASGGDALGKDICDADQQCVPCVNPLDKAESGYCNPLGVHEKACATGSTPTTGDGGTPAPLAGNCCTKGGKSSGICIAENAKTEDAPRDTCASGNKCVPLAIAAGTPVVCRAGAILGTGVCLDTCFNDYLDSVGSVVLDRDICGSTELCVPCSAMQGQGIAACP